MTQGLERYLLQTEGPRAASGDTLSASAAYRNVSAKDGFPAIGITTLYENFTRSVDKYPSNKCLGWREKKADGSVSPYVWKTYKEVGNDVALLASGLKAVDAVPKGGRIGVFGPNCPEWMIAMQVGFLLLHTYVAISAKQILLLTSHPSCNDDTHAGMQQDLCRLCSPL
jgi:long-chain acyl-CoA synthetase